MRNRRSTLFAAACALAALSVSQSHAFAQGTTSTAAPAQGLPLRQVSLFSSGVGYFGRSGMVNGDGQVELYFHRDDLNDVLKSLVITDPSGELRPATYQIDELLAQRPSQNDLPLPAAESLGAVLRNFQGASIEIESGGKTIRGLLIGVSTKTIKDKNGDVTAVEVANILTENGLVTFRLDGLDDGGVVRLLDPALNSKLRSQLERRAANLTALADQGFRPLKLNFAGRGEREVRAGYIQATSVWKTSYRLVFDSKSTSAKEKAKDKKDKKDDKEDLPLKPLLQGWAVVENTTDEDWKDVRLSLIAGRPVSFIMNLAAPLYVQRPEVPLPFAGAPAPQVYAESLDARKRAVINGAAGAAGPPGLAQRATGIFSNAGDFDRKAYAAERSDMAVSAEEMAKQGAQAQTEAKGELFEYAIRQPVSLNRGEAAMVPIVSQGVTGEKLSILDTADPTLRPVHGMRICNTTGLHLAGGPITIYEDGLYAGDAQITSIAPGDYSLISYALDLELVAGRKSPAYAQDTTGLVARNGVLTISRKQRKVDVFTFRNKATQDKTVLLQVPIDQNYELIEPQKASEKSPTEYRFEVPVPAGQSVEFKIVTEQPIAEAVALFDADIDALVEYTKYGKASPQLKAALEGVVTRRRKVLDLQGRRAYLEGQVKEISDEQARIRSNMNALSQNSDLYKRYVTKLNDQETQIEKLRDEIARLREAEDAARKELRAYVDTLSIDS
jgi:hypothetical protein